MHKVLVLDRLRNPDNQVKRLEDYKNIQAGFPAFSVAEEGDNGCLHYQGLVEIDITAPCYAQRFKRKGYKGNQAYSTKQIPQDDKDRTLQYLCKGSNKDTQPNVINNTMGLSYEQICDYHQRYWDEYTSTHSSKDEKKEETFAMRLYRLCEKKVLRHQINALGQKVPMDIDRFLLIETIMAYFCDNTKIFDKFIINRFAMLIESKLYYTHFGGFKRNVVQSIVEMMN